MKDLTDLAFQDLVEKSHLVCFMKNCEDNTDNVDYGDNDNILD